MGRHKPGFLLHSLLGFVPNPWFKKRTPEEWEEAIYTAHNDLSADEPQKDYIAYVSKFDYYGATLFGVKVSARQRVTPTMMAVPTPVPADASGVCLP